MKKTKEEIDKDEQEFYRLQDLMLNETTEEGRAKYAWQMFPIIKSAMASAVKQRANNHFVQNIDDIVTDFSIDLIKRFIKKPKKYEYFKTLIYYKSLNYFRKKYWDNPQLNDNFISLDQFYEENRQSLVYWQDYDSILDDLVEEDE